AFARFFRAPARNLFRLPDGVPPEVGALTADAVITSVHAVYDRGAVPGAATAAVIGAGGVGQVVIQLLKHRGLSVVAVSRSEAKLAVARSMGADEAWRAGDPEIGARSRSLSADGLDVVFDCVGSEESMGDALSMVRRCGRIVMVGEEDGSRLPADSTRIAQRELEVVGSRNGTRSNMETALDLLGRGVVRPIVSEVFPLEEANEALGRVRAGAAGRVVLRVGGPAAID
ncbi:MAG: zinc-binding dehydrogenase, partial [Nitrososphaerales archaeon]